MQLNRMKLETFKCPDCGEPPKGTVETLNGCAVLSPGENGTFEYSGFTEIWWDEQRTEYDEQERVHLICEKGHEWYSRVNKHGA